MVFCITKVGTSHDAAAVFDVKHHERLVGSFAVFDERVSIETG